MSSGLLLLLVIGLCLILVEGKIVFALEQYRHGARITIFQQLYGYDMMSSTTSLTKVGMKQHYQLGVHHRKKYIEYMDFLPEKFDSKLIKVISTNLERTKMSAMAHLYGMYPSIYDKSGNVSDWKEQDERNLENIQETIRENFNNFQKLFSSTSQEDFIFRYYDACQKLRTFRDQWFESQEFRKINLDLERQFPDLLPTIQEVTNSYDLSFQKISRLRDNLECLKYEGVEVEPGFTPELMRQIDFVSQLQEFSMIEDKVVFNYHNSRVMYYIFDWLDKKISNKTEVKWVSLSAHDTNLYLLMPYLGVNSIDCFKKMFRNEKLGEHQNCGSWPKFASNFVLELHEIDSEYYVQLIYNGEYMKLCDTTSHLCKYSVWKNSFKQKLIEEYKLNEMCGG